LRRRAVEPVWRGSGAATKLEYPKYRLRLVLALAFAFAGFTAWTAAGDVGGDSPPTCFKTLDEGGYNLIRIPKLIAAVA